MENAVSLYFGDKLVLPDSIVSTQEALLPIYYSFFETSKNPNTIILLNSTDDIPYWVNYNNIDIIPYSQPTDSGRYLFMIFDSNITPPEIYDSDFKKYHSLKDFGRLIAKIPFYIQSSINMLPSEINKLIISNKKIDEILDFCKSDIKLEKSVCEDRGFLVELAKTRLTPKLSIINRMSNEEIINKIKEFENFNYSRLKDKFPDQLDDFIKIILKPDLYPIAVDKLIKIYSRVANYVQLPELIKNISNIKLYYNTLLLFFKSINGVGLLINYIGTGGKIVYSLNEEYIYKLIDAILQYSTGGNSISSEILHAEHTLMSMLELFTLQVNLTQKMLEKRKNAFIYFLSKLQIPEEHKNQYLLRFNSVVE